MKIDKLKINGYGNIQNKEIDFNNKINIIYGKNEAGKSTIFKFIINMLYGCAKTKKGQEISDMEKYMPWKQDEFSGKMDYELDNKTKYEVYRDFRKKKPQIFNENMEDISKEYSMDKSNGINFFYEQTNIDEDLFLSSTAIMQNNVKLEEKNQNVLIQKITNIANTGDDSISFNKTMQKLKDKQLEEIGTSRSTDRPINKIEKELVKLKLNKNNIEQYRLEKENIFNQKENIKKEIENLEKEINVIKHIKRINEDIRIEKEKIKIKEEVILKNKEEIEKLNSEIKSIENNKNEEIKFSTTKNNKTIIVFFILFLCSIILHIVSKNNLFIFLHIIFFIAFIFIIYKNIKDKKIAKNQNEKMEKINYEKKEIENRIDSIKNNIKDEKIKIDLVKNNYKNKINIEKEKIKLENYNLDIESLFSNMDSIDNVLEIKQDLLNDKKVELHRINFNENNADEKIEQEIEIREKIEYLEQEKKELQNKNEAIEIAKISMEEAYRKMRENVTPKFVYNLSEIISKITNNKYTKIKYNMQDGLLVEKENGEYIPINRLSIGTIDQLYLSFRLSILKEISNERIPIILDEAFAYYDEDRLENILKYLNGIENQVIIFTCTSREKNILNKININYNLVNV